MAVTGPVVSSTERAAPPAFAASAGMATTKMPLPNGLPHARSAQDLVESVRRQGWPFYSVFRMHRSPLGKSNGA